MDKSINQLITFRKRKFNELINELERCVSGRSLSLLPYTTNQQSKYSERKTMSLINQILNGLDTSNKGMHNFYKSLFYCAIRAITTPYIIYESGNIFGLIENADNIDTTFSDLIHCMHSEDCFIGESLHRYPIDSTLANVMTTLYEVLSGKKQEKSNVLFDSRIDYSENELEMEDELEEPTWATMKECIDDSDILHDSLYDEYKELQESENIHIKKTFPSSAEYCKQFETLIDQFEQNYKFDFFNHHIEKMIDHFLTEQGLTLYSNEDAYVTLCTYVKKTIKQGNEFQTKGDFINGNRKR